MRKRFDERIPPLAGSRADLAKVPIGSILKRAMADSNEEVRAALGLLERIHLAGRQEAGIFLLGLLVHSRDDWKRRTEIVKRLKGFNTPGCADFLLAELRGVKNNNATRQYLAAVLNVLGACPSNTFGAAMGI